MSVLIKDMGKPKSCYAVIDGESEFCPFVNTDDDCVLLLKKGICEGTWADQYNKCPLVEEPERKKGKWIVTSEFDDCCYAKCNQCNVTQIFYYGKPLTNFCPNCGSYNGGEQE